MRLFFLFCFLIFVSSAVAQTTVITGHVYDHLTNENIPFCSVLLKGTTVGTVTDENGNYKISSTVSADSIFVSNIGYLSVTLPIRKWKTQVIDFALRQNKFDLNEIEIKAGENPADIIMRNVRDNKSKNSRTAVDAFQYEAYNKLEFDINNITDKFRKRKIFKPFDFVFSNVDSNSTNKKPFLPFFISENLSDIYFRKDPLQRKEIIKATKISGIENTTISQFMGDFYQNINVYDNFIYLFGKGFVSPIADGGNAYYKYYLMDSAFIKDKWCYKLKFKPRFKQQLTFTGDMWVNDSSWAVKKISMRIADDANINWVEDLAFVDEFDFVDGKQWMLTKEVLVVNIAPTENKNKETMGFIARKTTTYNNFTINQPKEESFYKKLENVTVEREALYRDEQYWDEHRHDSLSAQEKKIYAMVDTISTLPAFQSYVNIITIIATGYIDIGHFDMGHLLTFYSSNPVEGNRFKFGGKTNFKFSKKFEFTGYGAYGTKDKKFKYGGGIEYFLKDKKLTSFGGSYKFDVQQLGLTGSGLQSDNLFNNVFSRIQSSKITSVTEERIFFDSEILKGFSANISLTHKELIPLNNFDFTYYKDDSRSSITNKISSTEIELSLRYAYKEIFFEKKDVVARKQGRISLGSNYPITKITYTRGVKNLLEGEHAYDKIKLKVTDYLYLGNWGYTYYEIETGKIWGTLPYPLLEVHKGNETYSYDKHTFNLMNYYEFVSDQFASIKAEHHFGGIFLDRFPLLRKLKLREVVTCGALIGSINNANKNILLNPDSFYSLSTPYLEASAGIENILKVARIDFVKRFSYLSHPNTSDFGIRLSVDVGF